MNRLQVTIKGESPLLMHSDRLTDPLDPDTRQMKELTSKRKKTDADHEEIRWLDFCGGLYWDEKIGPYLPGMMIRAALVSAAKINRLGRSVQRGVQVQDYMCPLIYEGPRDKESLYKEGFFDSRSVVVNNAKTVRTRPCFDQWSLTFDLLYSDEIINEKEIDMILFNAGNSIGLADYRLDRGGPFGRFSITGVKEILVK